MKYLIMMALCTSCCVYDKGVFEDAFDAPASPKHCEAATELQKFAQQNDGVHCSWKWHTDDTADLICTDANSVDYDFAVRFSDSRQSLRALTYLIDLSDVNFLERYGTGGSCICGFDDACDFPDWKLL